MRVRRSLPIPSIAADGARPARAPVASAAIRRELEALPQRPPPAKALPQRPPPPEALRRAPMTARGADLDARLRPDGASTGARLRPDGAGLGAAHRASTCPAGGAAR
ncbi:hypothetical protein [Sorangium sp. So ce513]|uniref:hypothetical protein n=1 Tax=Sorangium sp. So ce513 TaxID=3133315 RepID=UPI003F626F85